ncbi:ArnT family glycosyltransferase [Amycolatopsis anabasis]|uniref:ArnT family glycosyltransferase n=1 Tax=Amycolatopsis anabasis TaxID=1840409 RepID=UPI00131C6374|nr:glycosyltransferase family 39 protein [Amycolatopsis anabasis]
MTGTLERGTTTDEIAEPPRERGSRAAALAPGAVCLLGLVLYGWGSWSSDWGNGYYSAAVRAMSEDFTAFVFGAYDSAGVVTVDKPPFALWPQVVSTWIFGFHGWSVLLPQIVEGVAAIFLLHRAVRRWAGEGAALIAALVLATTPITVAINRDNNPDTLLVLLLVAAAYAVTRSIRPGIAARASTGWLLFAGFLVGCGFLTKMLQAWIVLPVFAVAYFAGSARPIGRRLADLGGAFVVTAVSSLWWVVLVDAWPRPKPYIGSSADGSAWNLVLGYNGLGRVFGQDSGGSMAASPELDRVLALFGGSPSIGRMFNEIVAGQVSWLLPAALLVLLAAAVFAVRRWRVWDACRAGWLLWGGWLLVTGLVFSFAHGIWHPYYTTMLAPAIGAVVGAGAVLLWRRTSPAWWLLPAGVALTAGWAWLVIGRNPAWHGWLRYPVAVAGVLAVVALVFARFRRASRPGRVAGAGLGLVALLLAPLTWSAATALAAHGGGADPRSGPPSKALLAFAETSSAPGEQQGNMLAPSTVLSAGQRRILDYAKANSAGAPITLVVDGGAHQSEVFLLDSAETIAAGGGFLGTDDAPALAELADWAGRHRFRYVLLPNPEAARRFAEFGPRESPLTRRQDWVRENCALLDAAAYGGFDGSSPPELYDCWKR